METSPLHIRYLEVIAQARTKFHTNSLRTPNWDVFIQAPEIFIAVMDLRVRKHLEGESSIIVVIRPC